MQLAETEAIWDMTRQSMSKIYPSTSMDLWFSDLKLVMLDGNSAVFTINSDAKRDVIKNKFAPVIAEHLGKIIGHEVEIMVMSKESSQGSLFEESEPADTEEIPPSDENQTEPSDIVIPKNSAINPDYTFENFIVGTSNSFTYAACTAVANNPPASAYNPLFIHGPSGLGKTHLMYAITNTLYKKNPNMNIVFVKGEEFTNQLIEAISKKNTSVFREKYRRADVLLIDDIQFIAGKESTQEEFFHTFNALHEDHKQIILSSDRPPREIKTLEERLRTRFEWGLIADIQPPDFELRLAILKNKAELMRVDVPHDVMVYLAEQLKDNIRQIEGAIKKLGAMSFLQGKPISMELVSTVVPNFVDKTEPVSVTVDRIVAAVAKKYGVQASDIMGSRRSKDIAWARHVSIYITRQITQLSLPAIGKIYSRDHTTVMSSCSVVEKELAENELFETEINELIREVKG